MTTNYSTLNPNQRKAMAAITAIANALNGDVDRVEQLLADKGTITPQEMQEIAAKL